MKTYSFSIIGMMVFMASISFMLPDYMRNAGVMSLTKSINHPSTTKLSPATDLLKPLGYFGSSYSGGGYHNYGNYTIDVSGRAPNSTFSLNYNTYTIPNRFTLSNGTNQVFSEWRGTGNWPCQWGQNGISTQNTGSLSINIGTATNLTLTVESCNSTPPSGEDQWDVGF